MTLIWAILPLLQVLLVQAQATDSSSAPTTATATATTSATPSCTATLITKLCDYKEPGPEFAVASSGIDHCWDYCNSHQPCNFVIFAAGNPYTGTGTCWLYPGESFDESAGTSDGCSNPYLSVYDKPVCEGSGTATATAGECAATNSPSAIASVCEYPAPEDCFNDCRASESASHCLSLCAEADSCNYVVFNPHNPSNSPHASGTCWIYADGTYNADGASTCAGAPEQFVYKNLCPKPSPSTSSYRAAATESTATSSVEANESPAVPKDAENNKNAAVGSVKVSLPGLIIAGLLVLL